MKALLGPMRMSLAAFFILMTASFTACDYARMRNDEALNTYQIEMPKMPGKSIPVEGGYKVLASDNPNRLKNPMPGTEESVAFGKQNYGYFCIQCHGPNLEGYGTVGQSFTPLPTNLKSSYVQTQNDGELFYKIVFGFRRHPPLYATLSKQDTWAVIDYIKAFSGSKASNFMKGTTTE